MPAAAFLVPVTLTCSVLISLGVPSDPAAAASRETLTVSRHHVVQRDEVQLFGRATGKAVMIERSVGDAAFHPYLRVLTHRGRFVASVHPLAGERSRYRISGAPPVSVYSTACTPLSSHGSTDAWFNARGQASEIARDWGEAICSAAPGSTVTLASMFIFEGSRSVDGLIADLSAVAAYRHVHVAVIVAKSQFSKSQYAQFTHSFSFATIHECTYGCTEPGTKARMHLKFMTISSSTFGGPVVIESTLNWSPQQMDRQNGSAIYFYNNPQLYKAFTAEALRVEHRVRATEATLQRRWTDAGTDIAYAFNPSTVTSDPIVDELSSLPTCHKGDFVDVINANVTRGRFVGVLDKLRSEDCTVRVITEHAFRPNNADYTIRHLTTHDKFVLVHVAGMREVMTGSEDYRPASLTLADEQLVRVRLPSVVEAFERWFAKEWALAA